MKPIKPALLATAAFISLLSLFPANILAAPVNTYGDLKVNGLLDTTLGIKFPDGSTLNTSGLNGLLFNVGLVVDNSGSNAGTINSGAIKLGSDLGGVGIGSQQVPSNSLNKYGLDFYTNNASRLSILNNGYVGIGTRSPTNPLDVRLALGGATYARFGMDNVAPLYMIAGNPQIGFNAYHNSGYKYGSAAPAGYLAFNQDVFGGFSFTTAPGGLADGAATMTPRMVITNDGKVGIGTTTPSQALDVNGTVNATLFNGSGAGLTGVQKKYGGVAVVAKSGGDYSDPAVAMTAINYASWCGVPSATNPCLLKIMPGVYTVTTPVVMQPFIDIEGSGEKVTKITSALSSVSFPPTVATVNGSSNAELRFLTVENSGTGTKNVAILNSSASPTLTHVTATTSGGTGSNYGVYNGASSLTMTNVTATATGAAGSSNYGVYNDHVNSSATITHVTATASGGVFNVGVCNTSQSFPVLTYLIASASGGTTGNYGVFNSFGGVPTMTNVTATASGGASSYGVYNYDSTSIPSLNNVTASASGGTSNYGVYYNGNISWPVTMTNVTASASGGTNSYGISSTLAMAMTNVIATATGGTSSNQGIYNSYPFLTTMTNVTATATGGLYDYGIYLYVPSASAQPITMNNVTASASGGTSSSVGLIIGAYAGFLNHSVYIDRSTFTGTTYSIVADIFSTMNIGASKLVGTATVSGTYKCIGVYSGATYTALSATCQ